jgi:hypothetical protein
MVFNERGLLRSETEGDHKNGTNKPLNGEDIPESLPFDVRDEYSDNTKSKTLHEHCEENQGRLDWHS